MNEKVSITSVVFFPQIYNPVQSWEVISQISNQPFLQTTLLSIQKNTKVMKNKERPPQNATAWGN